MDQLKLRAEVEDYVRDTYVQIEDGCCAAGPDGHQARFENLLRVLSQPPMYTTLRLNTRLQSATDIIEQIRKCLLHQGEERGGESLDIHLHPVLHDVAVIPHRGPYERTRHTKEVIVGVACGMSVMRGADVYAQGIMGAPASMESGDLVSVYADVDGLCRKGLTQTFDGTKVFVGNGIAKLSRKELYCATEKVSGVGILMTEPVYLAPSLTDMLPGLVFPQNLPSVLCGHLLDPQPGEKILDMCAAPGGKTTHIATLMNNQGEVIAFDKSKPKIGKIMEAADRWGLSCIQAYGFDGTKSVQHDAEPSGGPPYPPATFDRILLDAPCSALGQRPAVNNPMKPTEVKSFPVLQRKLFIKAVDLLKPGGTLVYSTCSIPRQENEDQVCWALGTFPLLRLVAAEPRLAQRGCCGGHYDEELLQKTQRFDPSLIHLSKSDSVITANMVDLDTIGFFCAKFMKIES